MVVLLKLGSTFQGFVDDPERLDLVRREDKFGRQFKPWLFSERNSCSMIQRCLYQETIRQASAAVATGCVVKSSQ